MLFVISYTLHRKLTFVYIKEVGVAVYLSKKENVDDIWEKVKEFPDFIHIDLVDETMNKNADPVAISIGLEVQKKWYFLPKMTHIMSKYPSRWVKKVAPFSNVIIFHHDINESKDKTINEIKKTNRKAGISILYNTEIKEIKPLLNKMDVIQVLGIKHPGVSGQLLQIEALQKIDELYELKKKKGYRYELCFDGGVRLWNINQINARYIVSASSLLKSEDPIKTLYDIKTSLRYNFEKMTSLKKMLEKSTLETIKGLDYIKSATIVGSFTDAKSYEGISDIDIIIILDKFNKEKYDEILKIFRELATFVEADYGLKTKINSTFGPLKFNYEYDVVFHVMIYDVEGHITHCAKSPFTVIDWEQSNFHIRQKMEDICKVLTLQPNQLLSSRRSINTYTEDLVSNKINYRYYKFEDEKFVEKKDNYHMKDKDKYSYAYHVLKFLILNSLKIITKKNIKYDSNTAAEFFEIFPKNRTKYEKLLQKLQKIKNEQKTKNIRFDKKIINEINLFVKDLKEQYESLFFQKSTKLIFIRHLPTEYNQGNIFLGRKNDPDIKNMDDQKLLDMKNYLADKKSLKIYSSPLKRAISTAHIIQENSDSEELIINKTLIEIDYGDADGKDLEYLKQKHPKIIQEWNKGIDARFPDGENNEDVAKRIHLFLEKIKKEAKEKEPILVVTHNVVLRNMIGEHFNIPLKNRYKLKIEHSIPYEFLLLPNGEIYPNLTPEQIENIYKEVYGVKQHG